MSDAYDLLARLKMPPAADGGEARDAARSASASGIHQPKPKPQPASDLYELLGVTSPARTQSMSAAQRDERPSSDRANSLLNLLKFNQTSPPPASGAGPPRSNDPRSTSPKDRSDPSRSSPQNTLLQLLNRPTGQSTTPETSSKIEPQTETGNPDDIRAKFDDAEQTLTGTELEAVSNYVAQQENKPLEQAQQAVKEVAIELQQELQKEESQLKESMPSPMAEAFEDTVDTVAQQAQENPVNPDPLSESLDEQPTVFQFPMRPFAAVHIKNNHPPAHRVRDDLIIRVAALKRDFDQNDRTLAVASPNFIVYGMLQSKGGGIRIIRQDEGNSNHVFKKMAPSIFNVAIASPKVSGGADVVLATDNNGSVCWTSVLASEDPLKFAEKKLEADSFIFPPLPSQDDNTSGAQLKTRAKLSSRHPEFFAIGRGKSIHIVRPQVAMHPDAPYIDPVTRKVDTEKYFAEQCLKIATGKAGKDFAFSEDDTLIVSLDKAGRLKFWDIRPHTDPKSATYKPRSFHRTETKVPLMTLPTCLPTDKSWATSVQFVDKERQMAKGQALRYLIVGSKQNHTIHLWDIGLAKPVQEINFPHENEMDAICSVVYHPKTGILTVGHPTRNSVYLIHVSAPGSKLPNGLTQADYVRRVAEKDPTLPAPESTAIMSGMREISLSSIGQLRSLSVLSAPVAAATSERVESVVELYIMHSQGVTNLTLTRQDIGVGMDGRPIYPVDALSVDRIESTDIKSPPPMEVSQSSEAGNKSEAETWRKDKENGSDVSKETQTTVKPNRSAKILPAAADQKPTQPKDTASSQQRDISSPSASFAEVASRAAADQARADAGPVEASPEKTSTAVIPEAPLEDEKHTKEAFAGVEHISPSETLVKILDDKLEKLHRRIDEDSRVQEATGAARQEAVLRLVSSTLADNVEKNLNRIIKTNMADVVSPLISDKVRIQLETKIPAALNQHLPNILNRVLSTALPATVQRSLQSPVLFQTMSTQVTQEVSKSLRKSLLPELKSTVEETALAIIRDNSRQDTQQAAKIDQLVTLTSELAETVKALAGTQALFQREISQLRAQLEQQQLAAASSVAEAAQPEVPEAQRDEEVDEIAGLMTTGRFEAGTIKWLQSARQGEIFDKLFMSINPAYLRSCNQIIVLSVCAAVTATMDTHLPERLSWLEASLSTIDTYNADIADHVPGVMDALTLRLQESYMSIAETSPSNPILSKISGLVRRSKEVKLLMAH